MQKVDSGKIYAMKTLQKAEMLKRDQVSGEVQFRELSIDIFVSWPTFEPNVTSSRSLILRG